MATLVKVGDTMVNLDLVTQAYCKPGSVRLYFAVAVGKATDVHLDVIEFSGHDAAALRAYLETNSDDVLTLHPQAE